MNFSITRRGEYGVTAILYLARKNSVQLTQIHEVAEHCSLPEPFLAQILRLLVRAGIVSSKKGVHGGFTLGRPPEEISFLEVLEALEGPVAVNRCQSPIEDCGQKGCCSMEPIWTRVQDAMVSILRQAKLSEALEEDQFPAIPRRDSRR